MLRLRVAFSRQRRSHCLCLHLACVAARWYWSVRFLWAYVVVPLLLSESGKVVDWLSDLLSCALLILNLFGTVVLDEVQSVFVSFGRCSFHVSSGFLACNIAVVGRLVYRNLPPDDLKFVEFQHLLEVMLGFRIASVEKNWRQVRRV